MIKDELTSLLDNKLMILVLFVIALIPSIYSGLFLSSMWDPYGDLKYLPVAVVNNDKPYEYNDETLTVGDTLADSLSESDEMAFNIVDKETAEAGLENGTYYIVINIPENFSKNAASLMDDHPKKMQLDYETNPANNFLSTKLGASAINKIKMSVTEQVTETYANAVFKSLEKIGDGFDDATDGSQKIIDGEKKLASGNKKITKNLKKLASSTLTFRNGADTLEEGLEEYTEGVESAAEGADTLASMSSQVSDGISTLSSGIGQLKQGSSAVLNGLNTASSSISSELTDEKVAQIQQASGGLVQLNSGIQQFNTAIQNASGSTASDLQSSGAHMQTSYQQLAAAYMQIASSPTLSYEEKATLEETLQKAMDELYSTESSNTAIGKLNSAATSLSSSMSDLQTNSEYIAENADTLLDEDEGAPAALTQLLTAIQTIQQGLDATAAETGSSGLIEGMTAIDNGISQLEEGVDGDSGLASGFSQYSAGVARLNGGLATLASNNNTLLSGGNQLSTGAGKIASGSKKLAKGSETVGSGITTLKDGTVELRDALEDGADEVKDNYATDETVDMFGKPLQTEETQITDVPNNGSGMAPYMLSVGLWVAALAFCLLYPICRYKRLRSGIGWWASKAVILYPLGALMGLIAILVLHWTLGFDPVDQGRTMAAVMLAGVAFVSMQSFFNALMGKVGSFIMLLFMVMNLAGSAGTYPLEISGPVAQALNPYMPFTYTVKVFRSAMGGGGDVTPEIQKLAAMAIFFSIMMILLFAYRKHRIKHNKKYFYQWIEEKGLA